MFVTFTETFGYVKLKTVILLIEPLDYAKKSIIVLYSLNC